MNLLSKNWRICPSAIVPSCRARTEGIWVHLLACVLFAVLILASPSRSYVCCAQQPPSPSKKDASLSIVFVIDVSTSMYDIMDSLKQALADYIKASEPGDSISIVTFGTSSSLHFRGKIDSAEDVKRMLKFSETLSCSDEHTYITSGFDTGVRELYQSYRDNPSGTHILVFMSDGRNNPPSYISEEDEIKYEQIEERFFQKFEPGKDWFISYVSLKDIRDPALADFVKNTCRGNEVGMTTSSDGTFPLPPSISVAEILPGPKLSVDENNTILLGSAWLPITLKIPLQVRRLRGTTEGQSIGIKPILKNPLATDRLVAEVYPSEIVCGPAEETAEITLSISGVWDGEIDGALLFEPVGNSIVMVHPPQIPFKFESPPRIIIGKYTSELDQDQWKPIDWLAVGPLRPGEELTTKELVLKLAGSPPPPGLKILAVPDIGLPEGVTCTAKVDLDAFFHLSQGTVSLIVEADENVQLPEKKQYTGNLILKSPEFALSFSQDGNIPLKIFTAPAESPPPLSRLSKATGVVKEQYARLRSAIVYIAGIIVLPFLLFFSIRYLRHRRYLKKFVPVEGWLIVLERPERSELKNTDMGVISSQKKKDVLSIGHDPASDIHLDHKSVDKRHAEIRSGKEGNPTPAYIRYVAVNDVKVNGFLIDKEIKLEDRDIIDIGEFQFLYSNTHLKQVVVHYRNGDVRYGVPLSWGIEEEGFILQPEGDGAEDFQLFIRFDMLKGVFFVKDFDKEIARKMKHSSIFTEKDHVLIEFLDGEKMEAYTIRDYDPKAPRFFIVPKVEPGKEENNTCVLVERQFFKRIKVLERVPA